MFILKCQHFKMFIIEMMQRQRATKVKETGIRYKNTCKAQSGKYLLFS